MRKLNWRFGLSGTSPFPLFNYPTMHRVTVFFGITASLRKASIQWQTWVDMVPSPLRIPGTKDIQFLDSSFGKEVC